MAAEEAPAVSDEHDGKMELFAQGLSPVCVRGPPPSRPLSIRRNRPLRRARHPDDPPREGRGQPAREAEEGVSLRHRPQDHRARTPAAAAALG